MSAPSARRDGDVPNNAGIVAQSVHVETQYINLRGQPEWIQSLSLDELLEARARLKRASSRHDIRAIFPIIIAAVLAMLVLSLLSLWMGGGHRYTTNERWIIGFLGVDLAFPIWFANRDVIRRHRLAVKAADKRWAEIEVEIAMRSPCQRRNHRIKSRVRYLRLRIRQRRRG